MIAEVWSDGGVRIGGTGKELFGQASAVLQHKHVVVPTPAELPATPVLGTNEGLNRTATFLGHVIVEFLASGAVVIVTGADQAAMISAAARRLQQVATTLGAPL